MNKHIILAYDKDEQRETLVNIEFADFNDCLFFCSKLNSQQDRYVFSTFQILSERDMNLYTIVNRLTDLEGIEHASI